MDGVVEVAGGRIRGVERDGLWTFSGIPYAGPPVGEWRWRPPRPVERWSSVRQADEFGPIAPQAPPLTGVAIPGDPVDQDEDCLSLNVWTPRPDEGRRPVMVWIHGGGFTSGTGAGFLYRGGYLARAGDVVVVTINYRLGALGFFAHPGLSTGVGGNWGLLDQIAALEWVRDNIASFGGDPRNVTVFGESAGGMSVSALLGIPRAKGLFHRAIVQSGPPYTHGPERARIAAEELAAGLGLREITRETLVPVPAADLVAVTHELQGRPPLPGELPLPFLPVVDGEVLPRHPDESVAAGSASDVPLLIGTTRDELSFFALGDARLNDLDDERLHTWMALAAPQVPPGDVIDHYRAVRSARNESTSPIDLLVAAGSDLVFRRPSLVLAVGQHSHQPATFVYLFTWETPAFDGLLGACHGLEIPFVFGGIHRPLVASLAGGGPAAESLSESMRDAWISFARSGDPSHPSLGRWDRWDPARRATMVFGRTSGQLDAPRNDELSVWDGVFGPVDASLRAPGAESTV